MNAKVNVYWKLCTMHLEPLIKTKQTDCICPSYWISDVYSSQRMLLVTREPHPYVGIN